MQGGEQKRYWFKRKQSEWGWTPSTWEGWAVTILYFILVVRFFIGIGEDFSQAASKDAWVFFIVLTILLIVIMWRMGEPLRFK